MIDGFIMFANQSQVQVVFVKDSVLYCLRTRQRAPKARGPSALALVRFADMYSLWFPVIQWLQIAFTGIIQIHGL